MAIQVEPLAVGQALIVDGTVKVDSVNGMSSVLQPNGQIFLGDRIDTGNNGEALIILNDGDHTQLNLGSMSEVCIDDDVVAGSLPDFSDVAMEVGLAADLLQNWESLEPLTEFEAVAPTMIPESDNSETASTDAIPGIEAAGDEVAAVDVSDDGFGGMGDDLDLSNLIPPPEDAS